MGPRVIKKNRPGCDNNKLRSRKCSNKNKWTKAGARNEAASGSFSTLAFAFIMAHKRPVLSERKCSGELRTFPKLPVCLVSIQVFSWKTFESTICLFIYHSQYRPYPSSFFVTLEYFKRHATNVTCHSVSNLIYYFFFSYHQRFPVFFVCDSSRSRCLFYTFRTMVRNYGNFSTSLRTKELSNVSCFAAFLSWCICIHTRSINVLISWHVYYLLQEMFIREIFDIFTSILQQNSHNKYVKKPEY